MIPFPHRDTQSNNKVINKLIKFCEILSTLNLTLKSIHRKSRISFKKETPLSNSRDTPITNGLQCIIITI